MHRPLWDGWDGRTRLSSACSRLVGTIRQNVLFGLDYEPARYRATMSACAMLPDIARLERGDQSFIGENGLVLSGGQKQRLALARAVYADAQIYLLVRVGCVPAPASHRS